MSNGTVPFIVLSKPADVGRIENSMEIIRFKELRFNVNGFRNFFYLKLYLCKSDYRGLSVNIPSLSTSFVS